MNRKIQIGDFIFRLRCPEEVMTPDNFMLFVCAEDAGKEMYTYDIQVSEKFPEAEGKLIADRPDLKVYEKDGRELRLIGVKGMNGYYACYRETAEDRATVVISRPEIQSLRMDPVFSSLFALEKRLASRAQMVLHCAYVEYKGEAVLFSAPSGTGKTTQAGLWEKYRGSRTINGDRSLLGKRNGRWFAQGWPVCGTSEVCFNEAFPVRAVVMLSQARENSVQRLTPGKAFPLVYSQVTINKWNMADHMKMMDLIEELLSEVPVFHLQCTISEEAVSCLESALDALK